MFSAISTLTLSTFFSLLLPSITPASSKPLDVYSPSILTPQENDTWVPGQIYTVTWDISDPPAQITNPIGQIWLRKGDVTSNDTLASGFNMTSGSQNITCPYVSPDSDYRVVLYGTSGNWSPPFTIVVANISTPAEDDVSGYEVPDGVPEGAVA